jgi:hypothetical protein
MLSRAKDATAANKGAAGRRTSAPLSRESARRWLSATSRWIIATPRGAYICRGVVPCAVGRWPSGRIGFVPEPVSWCPPGSSARVRGN